MAEPFILLQEEITRQGSIQPSVPINAEEVVEASSGGFSPFYLAPLGPLVTGVAYVLSNTSGSGNLDAADVAGKLKFGRSKKTSDIQLLIQATALRRNNGRVDISLKTAATYHPAYERGADGSLHSLFQDQVSFRVWPTDPSLVTVNSQGVSPATDMLAVGYSNQVGWSVGGGFGADASGPNASVTANYSTEVSASNEAKDFDLQKISETGGRLGWVSQMRNLYSGSKADTNGYNPVDPLTVIHNGAVTKSLKDLPKTAMNDLDLVFHAAYTTVSPAAGARQVGFQLEARQRLIYARLVNGTALVVPYYVIYHGGITLDLASRALLFDGDGMAGYKCNARVPD